MKKILFILLTICTLAASAQTDTTKAIPTIAANGYAYKHLQALYAFLLPTDTFTMKSNWRGVAFKGTTPYYWNGTRWEVFGTGSGITQLGTSPFGLIRLNDSTYLVDSMNLITKYQSEKSRDSLGVLIATKQATLVSGTNIKTINGNSLLGSGDLVISGSSDSSTLIVDTTFPRLASVISEDTLKLKSLRVQLNGSTVTPTETDSTLLWNIQALVAADTANKWITSVYRKPGTDSVFYIKGGTHTFAFKDSSGVQAQGFQSVLSTDSRLTQDNVIHYSGYKMYDDSLDRYTSSNDMYDGDSAGYIYSGKLGVIMGGSILGYTGYFDIWNPEFGQYEDSVGQFSFSWGVENKIIGQASIALGSRNQTFVNSAIAIGDGNKSGDLGNPSSNSTFALGNSNTSIGFISGAIGEGNYSSSDASMAIGFADSATAPSATAMGSFAKVSGAHSFGVNLSLTPWELSEDSAFGVNADNYYLLGVNDGGTSSDSVLVIGANGQLKKRNTSAFSGGGSSLTIDSLTYNSSTSRLTLNVTGQSDVGVTLPNSYLVNALNADSISKQVNDSTVKLKSVTVSANDPYLSISTTRTDTTINHAIVRNYLSEPIISFTAGAGFAADTTVFTDSTLYGSFYTGQDSFYVTKAFAVLKGQSGDTLGIQMVYNDTFNVTGTVVGGGTLAVNNRTTGNSFDISTNSGIPPNVWVWLKSPTVVAGKKPEYLSVTLIGYRRYVAP